MEKRVIVIPKKQGDFKCRICNRMVEVRLGKEWTIETDMVIMKTWDYGHKHHRTFRVYGGKQYPMHEA